MPDFPIRPGRRYLVIACEIFFREASAAAARSPDVVDLHFLPKSLHDIGETAMSARLQGAIDERLASYPAEGKPDAVVMLYGLCNNGIRGLRAPVPLIAPRGHDCITLLLGSRARFEAHFAEEPATFYRSPGWIERDSDPDANPASITSRLGITRDYDRLVEEYGEDNAAFLMETMGNWMKHYRRLSLINTGLGPVDDYRRASRAQADKEGWRFEEIAGDTGLIDRMLAGIWNDDEVLVVRPGETIATSNDAGLITAVPGAGPA
jgi:hypothetical protein